MNKPITILSLASLLFSAAFAQKPTRAPAPKPPTKIKCAVQTGNDVNIANATKHHMYADYKGNRYFFCCDGCPQEFKAHPEKYAKGPHMKSPAKTK